MPFCTNCGHEIKEGDQYCIVCGQKIGGSNFNQHTDTMVRKCPSCGEPLPALAINCPACGYELRDIKTGYSEIASFLNHLKEFGVGNKEIKNKANYIRLYSVPDNREAMFEFLTYAVANVDTRLMGKASNLAGMKESEYKAQMLLTQAWLGKYEEVYKRAEKLYGNDATFQQIRLTYENKRSELKSARKKYRWANSTLRSCLLAFVAGTLVLAAFIFAGIMLYRVFSK